MNITTFDTIKSRTGTIKSTDWRGFADMVTNAPAYPEKVAQPLIKLGLFVNNSRANDLQQITGIELDYDDGQVTPEQAADMLTAAGCQAIVCSTYTSAANKPKWRAFLPLSKQYAAQHRQPLVAACDAVLGHIIAPESYREKQIFFVGRNPAAPYTVIETTGSPLDGIETMRQLSRDYLHQQQTEQAAAATAQRAELQRRSVENTAPGQISVIDAFNDCYQVAAILTAHGYQRKGKRYMAPGSKSGMAGINALACCDGHERIYSHHDSDPLNTGRALDAFDCYSVLEHNGNISRAVAAAGDLLSANGGLSVTDYNRAIHLQPRIVAALQRINPDSLQTVAKVARALRALPDGFGIWQQWAGKKYNTQRIWAQTEGQRAIRPGFVLRLADDQRGAQA